MTVHDSPLGRPTVYPSEYTPSLLFPLPRAPQRAALGIGAQLPFMGADQWTGFELGWLNERGKPQVAIVHITVPCETTHMVESKSLKLYLNSFSDTRFAHADAVLTALRRDLSAALWSGEAVRAQAGVRLVMPESFDDQPVAEMEGVNLDRLDLDCDRYQPDASLLSAATQEAPVTEVLCSRLLKSNCPVTGQPDWGSVQISYSGPQIDQAGLLRYLVSFRGHQGFHEHCVERIYMDVRERCTPTRLAVHARYTRRGGLDINPWRSSHPLALPPNVRTARQ